jgi:site-specific recombinase XerD
MDSSFISLSEAVELFVDATYGEVADSTLAWYRNRLARLVDRLGADTAVSAISVEDIRAYRRGLLEQDTRWENHQYRPSANHGLSAHTIDGHLRAVKRFFRFLVEEGRLEASPADRVKRPRLPDVPPKEIPRQDILALVEVTADWHPRDLAIVLFYTYTGCRAAGLATLTLTNLRIDDGSADVIEKGNKSRAVYFGSQCQDALRAYLDVRPKVGHDFVFCSFQRPYNRLTSNGVYQMLKRAGGRAGLDGNVGQHAFRHSFAHDLLREGADLGTVSQLMGHEGIDVTNRSYGRWARKELQERHKKFSWLDSDSADE